VSAGNNLELARQGMDAWNRRDVDAMLEMSSPDLEFLPAIAVGVEGGGSIRGEEDFRRFFAGLTETWETFVIEAAELRDLGDHVLAVGRVRAKGRASGVELDEPIAAVIWLRDGRLQRMHTFLDHEAAVAAAGEQVS
jgi:ketosteroid isomerase-like protein